MICEIDNNVIKNTSFLFDLMSVILYFFVFEIITQLWKADKNILGHFIDIELNVS